MIEKIIEYSARNRVVIGLVYALVIGWGIWSVYNTPVDAIPDLSDNQVIVFTEWSFLFAWSRRGSRDAWRSLKE